MRSLKNIDVLIYVLSTLVEVFNLRENIYEEKKIQSTKKFILTNVRLYNLNKSNNL